MFSTHAILVNTTYASDAANKNLSEMTKEEIKEMVINYATNETECFYGPVFDCRDLVEDQPVVFAADSWSLFEEILLAVDRDQKNYAKHMLNFLKREAGSTDVSEMTAPQTAKMLIPTPGVLISSIRALGLCGSSPI